jgi:arylsulfatase A-like enzyme
MPYPLLALLALWAPPQVTPPPRSPSVIVFVLDDVGALDLAPLQLPVVRELARRGVSFTRAYGMPVCYPARRTMLSGEVWPDQRGGVPCTASPIPGPGLGDLPLPALFQGAGFQTGGFGKWHLGAHPDHEPYARAPFAHGFDVWRAGVPANVEICGGRNYRIWTRMEDGELFPFGGYHTQALVSSFGQWWTQTRGPKMAWVAFQAAHEPFHRPPDELLPPGYPPTPDTRSKFEAMIVSADIALGQMLAQVDLKQTYVILVGDNGTPESLAPDPLRAKTTTYERGLRIPLIIAGPGVRPGVCDAVVHSSDVFETLRVLCRLDRSQPARDSVSLVPCLTNTALRPRDHVFVEYNDELCVVSARYKLREEAGVQAFYDLALDPLEDEPLPLDDPALAPLIAQHRAWLEAGRR